MTERKPRYLDDHHASYKAKFDPDRRYNITPKTSCTLRDQQSDPNAPRAVTPKREAMWKNFSGSQAALLTGHAPTAHSGTHQPKLAPASLAEQEAAAGRSIRPTSRPISPISAARRGSANNSGTQSLNDSSNNVYSLNNTNTNNNMKSSSSTMRSHNASTYSQDALMEGAKRQVISGGANDSPLRASTRRNSNPHNVAFGRSQTPQPQPRSPSRNANNAPGGLQTHWSLNVGSTKAVPVEKNSASVTSGRNDSIVRSAPFAHHKNMVFPEEDKTVDTTRDRLWMNRPLKNGQYTASRKRTYNVPTFRGSDDTVSGGPATPTNGMNMNNDNNNNNNTTSNFSLRVPSNTGTSYLGGGETNNNNQNVSTTTNNTNNNSSYHFTKRKIAVPTHLEGASATVTEEDKSQHRFMIKPLGVREFKPPYNEERTSLMNAPPEEIPAAARLLGKRRLSPARPSGTPVEQCEGGWSDQPVGRRTGTRHFPNNYGNSKDFPVTDSPPKPGEIPAFRPSVVPLQGAPAFVPSINRASTPQPRSNSPSRRGQFTPRDHDIFGAKEQRQPWHPGPNMQSSISRNVELTAAPGSIEIKRCRGVGAYSPARVQPQYRF